MARISEIDPDNAPEEVKKAIADHIASGHRITNVKRTMLHHLPSFMTLEVGSYDLDDDLQRLIGKLDGDIFEYAVSTENECLVCSVYFSRLLREEHGIDPATFEFNDRQKLLIEYARVIAHTPKAVSDELFARMKAEFTEEQIVAITTMGVMMTAMNYFNDILQIEPE
jgi:hypothetical protein